MGLDEINNKSEHLEKMIDLAYIHSELPAGPDLEKIEKLQMAVLIKCWESTNKLNGKMPSLQ